MTSRSGIFVSYSHRDIAWLERLQVHLKPLCRSGVIDLWDDTRIKPGDMWQNEIQAALDQTCVAILLVSADFMASDFIVSEELPPLLSAAEQEGIVILPVILSASSFTTTPDLHRFQAVNPPSEPVIGMSKVDREALFELLARTVQALVSAPERDRAVAGITRDIKSGNTPFDPEQRRPAVAGMPRSAVSELQENVNATRQVLADFAPERSLYMALIGVSVIVCLLSAGKLIFGGDDGVSQQVTMMSLSLGSGGASAWFCGQLLKVKTRAYEFMREITASAGEMV